MAATTRKKPWVAFILSFLVPGVGLAYAGSWGLGVLNLVIALGAAVLLANFLPDYASAISAGICAGSAALAKVTAENANKRLAVQTTPSPVQAVAPIIDAAPRAPEPFLQKDPTKVACPKCGANTDPGNFCAECGAPLATVG